MAREIGARPGDFAVAFNQRNGQSSFAIFGDVGPSQNCEGSVALAENLGIRPMRATAAREEEFLNYF